MYTAIVVAVTAVVTSLILLIVRQFVTGEKTLDHQIEHLYGIDDERFTRSMEGLLPPTIVGGNRITAYVNGDQIFPAMLDAIRSARQTLCFETFIYWSGRIGQEFAAALIERAKAGVKVHVLLDWLGSHRMEPEAIERMESVGIEVQRYHPIRWYTIHRFNNRTHRKLLIIDGHVGFTGGVGIADQWTGNAQDPEHWRDTHFKVEGPAVAQLQSAFMDNWLKTQRDVLHGDDYFPKLEHHGACKSQVFMSSPAEGSESVRLMYLLSITSATRSIRLSSAYFVPDDLAIGAFVAARKRGVRVQIIVPGKHIDAHVVRRASRARWGKLLEAGVEIHEFQPTMYHCKMMVVDEVWTSVGSTNFDNRSFRLNDEVNLNVLDRDFAAGQIKLFEGDLTRSRQITPAEWQSRPMHEKLKENAAALLRSQL